MAFGVVSMGAVAASAADSGTIIINRADKQAYKQFVQETAAVSAALKAKEAELNEQYAYRNYEGGLHEGIDVAKINKLEADIHALKDKLNASAEKYDLTILSSN